ncbi:hypothetical protein HaLaN_12517 [Haematococcus lacustris]|uniref:Uncharacterized protein n=1 Tax=Haematococcus lacustris TaxID=44745 RepID=A0A699ZAJ2_HAELA|nr:hypothetical protein HaLaN_12517 [Haematococcus lacustris]
MPPRKRPSAEEQEPHPTDVVPGSAPPQAPTGPTQQPGSLTASSLRAWAQHSPCQPSAASAPRLSRQLSPPRARARLPKPSQHHSQAAHWGEQVAPTGAVLVAKAGEAARQGQGVPRPGLQAAARQATQGPAAAARCGTVVCGPPILSCHQLTLYACKTCQLYTIALVVRQ